MRRRQEGYTLLELLMVTAIIGILAMIGPTLMIQLQDFYLVTTARNDIQRDARASMDIVNRFLRQAKARTIVIDTPSSGGPYSRIAFSHIDGRVFQFYQDNMKLVQVMDGKSRTISSNLVYLAFTFPRSDYTQLVSVSMTMGKSAQRGKRKELELTLQKIQIMN